MTSKLADAAPTAIEEQPSPIGAAFNWLLSAMNAAGTVWIFVIMLLICADVFFRYVFNSPIVGVPLVITMSIIAIVSLQLPDALRLGRLTRNEALLGKYLENKPDIGYGVQAAYHLAGAVLMWLLIDYSYSLLMRAMTSGAYLGNRGDFILPEWPFKLIMMVGAAACGIQFLLSAANDLRKVARTGNRRGFVVFACAVGIAAALALVAYSGSLRNIGDINIGLLSVLLVLVLVYAGVHVAVALGLLSFLCIWLLRGDVAIAGKMLALAAHESLQRYEFGVIPLFVLMGLLVSVSDIGKDTYDVANQLFRRVKGGLGHATVAANAVFAAVTGTSIASASVFTKVAVPEMLRHGYNPRFAVGVVAGSSVLGMLIPPSLLFILFGILAEQSIGDLFIAGIVPGILLAFAYAVQITIMAKRFPRLVYSKAIDVGLDRPLMTSGELLIKSFPIVLLIALVLGGLYGGIFTATEAGGVGAFCAFVLALLRRSLTWKSLWRVLVETGHVTAAICFLLISAHLYSRMGTATGIPNAMEAWVNSSGLGFYGLIAMYMVIVLLLGTLIDAGSIMLITVPIVVPLLVAMQASGVDFDMIWVGVITVIGVEVGLLTPPFGLAVFVVHNNLRETGITVNDIFWGATPFAATMTVVLILVIAFPWLALCLL